MLVIQLKKTVYNTKITEIENKLIDQNHDKYITTPDFSKLTAENFPARLKQASLVTKTYFDAKLKVPIKTLTQIKQNIYVLKIN